MSTKTDYDKTTSLRSESAMQECGLFHDAVVELEPEDALIALREACMQRVRSLDWSQLESYMSLELLVTCHGVKVLNGHATEFLLVGLYLKCKVK